MRIVSPELSAAWLSGRPPRGLSPIPRDLPMALRLKQPVLLHSGCSLHFCPSLSARILPPGNSAAINQAKSLARTALYQGALSVISKLPIEPRTLKEAWLIELVKRAGVKRTCIALANKTVRTAWALLATGKSYEPVLLG